MDKDDLIALADLIADSTKGYVDPKFESFRGLIDELKLEIEKLPKPEIGERGARGERGEKGDPGESVRGERGEKGEKGDRGQQGERGETGEPGLSVAGKDGERGIDGKDGRDGRDGKDGVNGRDALELSVTNFEQGKTYPRGTFASYRGGLVRIDGPAVHTIVRGIDTVEILQGEDLRSFTVKIVLTDGYEIEKQFAMPTVIYRGIYSAGNEYSRGDSVTQQGSTWICVVEQTASAPAAPNNKDWQLMVRSGRDGKDLMPKEVKAVGPVRLA